MPADNLFIRALRAVLLGIIMFCLGLIAGGRAHGAALTDWSSLDPVVRNTVPGHLEVFKGQSTDLLYPLEVDQTNGALPVEIVSGGTGSNAAAGPTGSPVPADADYQGLSNAGTLIGAKGDSSGRTIVAGDGTAGSPAGGVLTTQTQDATATGTITSTQNVSISTAGYATVGVQVTGTFTGTIFVEWSPDGTNWYNTTWASVQTGALALTFTAAGAGTIQCTGASSVRLRGGSVATGTATVYLRVNTSPSQFMLDNPLPTGSNTIGAVNQAGNWSTRTQDGSGNAITSTASALDVNLKSSGVTALSSNVAQFGGNNVQTGTGTSGVGIPRVTVSNDSTVGLVAGSAIIGKVGIDQTTPGTTNGVQVNAALPAGTNLLGKVGIDQTTPGTTNAIQATSATAATWQAEGAIAFGSLTTAFATILTPSANTKIISMRNNTNGTIAVSFDAGVTTNFTLDPGDAQAIDYTANGLIAATSAIQVKYTGSAPTSGTMRVNACH